MSTVHILLYRIPVYCIFQRLWYYNNIFREDFIMNTRKKTYFTKLITSYSLILGIVFHFILSNNVKQELLNENMISLQNVTEQFNECYANIYLISKKMANNSSLSRLAEADHGEQAFYYNAYIAVLSTFSFLHSLASTSSKRES